MLSKKSQATVILLMLFVFTAMSPAAAFGRGRAPAHFRPHGARFDALPFAAATLFIAGASYYYWEGEYYRREAKRYVVVNPPIGAVVTTIPAQSQTVVIDGVPYYIINGNTYIYTNNGYQVVPTPRTLVVNNAIEQTTINPNEAFTVNILNNKGSYTAVTLKRAGDGFTGPQGEYYAEFPKIEQLKVMYGK